MLKWNDEYSRLKKIKDIIISDENLRYLSKKYNKEILIQSEEVIMDIPLFSYELQFGSDEEIPIYIVIEYEGNTPEITSYIGGNMVERDLEREYLTLSSTVNRSILENIKKEISTGNKKGGLE